MRSLHALRAAMVAELEEISAHYKGIIDHLDALEGLRSPKAPPVKKPPAPKASGKKKKGAIIAQVKSAIAGLCTYSSDTFSIAAICKELPSIPKATVARAMYDMAYQKKIQKVGDADGRGIYQQTKSF